MGLLTMSWWGQGKVRQLFLHRIDGIPRNSLEEVKLGKTKTVTVNAPFFLDFIFN
jgi:hypothetical protein